MHVYNSVSPIKPLYSVGCVYSHVTVHMYMSIQRVYKSLFRLCARAPTKNDRNHYTRHGEHPQPIQYTVVSKPENASIFHWPFDTLAWKPQQNSSHMVRPIKEGQKREDDTKRSQKCAVKGPEEVREPEECGRYRSQRTPDPGQRKLQKANRSQMVPGNLPGLVEVKSRPSKTCVGQRKVRGCLSRLSTVLRLYIRMECLISYPSHA